MLRQSPDRSPAQADHHLNPLAVGVGNKVNAHAGILADDAAHLLVEFMECPKVVHDKGDVGILTAVVAGFRLVAVPGELDFEKRKCSSIFSLAACPNAHRQLCMTGKTGVETGVETGVG